VTLGPENPQSACDREVKEYLLRRLCTLRKLGTMKYKRSLHNVLVPVLKVLGLAGLPKGLKTLIRLANKDYGSWLHTLIKNHGKYQAAKQAKYVFSVAKRVSLGLHPLPQSGVMWYKSSKSGMPRRLYRVERLLVSKKWWRKKIGLTILSTFRLINHPPTIDVSSRLSPSKYTYSWREWVEAHRDVCKKYRLDRIGPSSKMSKTIDPWIGSKGPYGLISIEGAPLDAYILTETQRGRRLLRHVFNIRSWCDPTFDWIEYISKLSEFSIFTQLKPSEGKEIFARFVFLSEGGGKTRGVTPVNYHIQSALLPLHNFFMEMLRRIDRDCSFDEAKGLSLVADWSRCNLLMDSIDLSDATDRFPLHLMRRTVEFYCGMKVADSWFELMRIPISFREPFVMTKSFRVGAPMGLYALWPVYTLTHHVMVRVAVRRTFTDHRTFFTRYVIRGDDIVIADPKVSSSYVALANELDLPFSQQKTLSASRDGAGVAEFSKHLFQCGRDIGPIGIKSVVATTDYEPMCLVDLLPEILKLVKTVRTTRDVTLPQFAQVLLHGRFRNKVGVVIRYLQFPWNLKLHQKFYDAGLEILPVSDLVMSKERVRSAIYALLTVEIHKKLTLEVDDRLELAARRAVPGDSLFEKFQRAKFKQSSVLGTRCASLKEELSSLPVELVYDEGSSRIFPVSRVLSILRELEGYEKVFRRSRKTVRRLFLSEFSTDLVDALRWSSRPEGGFFSL
jgi:hypothetical protein